jgi:Fe-Mn family superoxide dismutase
MREKTQQTGGGTRPGAGDPGGDATRFTLPALPYGLTALEPFLSSAAMHLHYGQYHRDCVAMLNKIVAGTAYAGLPLLDLVRRTAVVPGKAALFHYAAQCRNHELFWRSLRPGGGAEPDGRLRERLAADFGSIEAFKHAFAAAGLGQLGSGWIWLVQEGDALAVVRTSNAETPEAQGRRVLFACDVWEHAYCIDYQNRRADFLNTFLDRLVNWDFASQRLA